MTTHLLGARLERYEEMMTATLPIHAELVSAFETAFEGCGTTLPAALQSPDYARLLERFRNESSFPSDSHVCESLLGHFAISDEVCEYMHFGRKPSPLVSRYSIFPVGEPVSAEVTALIFLLGEKLIQATREHCLSAEMRDLAARWRNAHLNGEDGKELARELYRQLNDFRSEARKSSATSSDEHDQMQILKRAATWWVEDQQRQSTDLFLPLPLAQAEGDYPNCQGLALLACAFAAEAGVPNLRTNLLASGRTITGASLTRSVMSLAQVVHDSGIVDMSEVIQAANFQILYDGLENQSRVDFHSSCLLQCGAASYIVDPYATTIYQIQDSSRSPFDLVEASSLPGFNAPAQYLNFTGSYFGGMEDVVDRWLKFFREELPKLSRLATAPREQFLEESTTFMVEAYRIDHEVKGHEASEFDPEQRRNVQAVLEQKTSEGSSQADLVKEVVDSAFTMALEFEKLMTDALQSHLGYAPPIACEYGRPVYCTGFTTLQTIAVLHGAGDKALTDLASYGCDQSVLYILAKNAADTRTRGEEMRGLDAMALGALWGIMTPVLHPATRQLLEEIEDNNE